MIVKIARTDKKERRLEKMSHTGHNEIKGTEGNRLPNLTRFSK